MTEDPIKQLRGFLVEETAKCQALEAKLAEMTTYRDNHHKLWCKEHEKTKALEQQVAVLRAWVEQLRAELERERELRIGLEKRFDHHRATAGMVRLDDVERVIVAMLEYGDGDPRAEAARAWLDEVRR